MGTIKKRGGVMHSTAINILKMLHQTKIKKENLAYNLEIKEGALLKNINLINNFLRDLKLNEIIIEKGVVKLKLEKREWSKVFEKVDTLTFEEKVDYLCIKIIYYGFINLEKEREKLQISRSSITRCFLSVKELLENRGSKIVYNNGKGSEIIDLSKKNRVLFSQKLTKLILEEEILTPLQKELLNDIKGFSIKLRITKLVSIYNCLKLPAAPGIIAYLCSLSICPKYFQEKNYNVKDIKNRGLLQKIETAVNTIGGAGFSESYKEILVYYIYSIATNKHYLFENIVCKTNEIIDDLYILVDIKCSRLKSLLFQQIYFGILRKETGILKIRDVDMHSEDIVLLNIVEKILKKHSQKLYICDKYIIISFLKEQIFKKYIDEIDNVLILVGEINTLFQLSLKEKLKENFPNIDFNIEYNFLNIRTNKYKFYDIIINDTQTTLRDGDIFYRIKKALEKEVVKNRVKNNIHLFL